MCRVTHVALQGWAWIAGSIIGYRLLDARQREVSRSPGIGRLWGRPHLLSSPFPAGLSVRCMKLMSQLLVLPMLKMYKFTWIAFFVHNSHFQNGLVFSDYSEDGGSMSVRNLGAYMPMYTASYSRILGFSSALRWKPRISHELRRSEDNRSLIRFLFLCFIKLPHSSFMAVFP
jgi:hypothetical protein